jgi:hypothetical protein
VSLTGGTRPRAVAIGDVNGDLRPDIIAANEASNDLSIFQNLGPRQFGTLPGLPLPQNGIPVALAAADMNGDGSVDVVVVQNGTLAPNVVLGLNDGGGAFTSTLLQAGLGPRDLAVGDLNGDQLRDIVVANSESNTLTLLLTGGGTYTRKDITTGGWQPSAISIANIDGDGDLDLVVVNKRQVENVKVGNVAVLLNNGNAGFGAPASLHVRGREVPTSVCTGDIDGDGEIDAAVAGGTTDDIMVLRGRGDGTWLRDERVFPVEQGARALVCIDVNGDGRTDVVFGGRRGGDIDLLSTAP